VSTGGQARNASLQLADRQQHYEDLQSDTRTREVPQDYSKLTKVDQMGEATQRYSRTPSRSPAADYSEIADYVGTEPYTRNVNK